MLKIPKEMIIQRIIEQSGISEKQLQTKIKDKLDQLSGLISEEGALHIIANELGVKVFEQSGELKIKNIVPGMRTVNVTGKVIDVYEVRTFDKDGRQGKVGNFMIGDETGTMRVVAWNDKADFLTNLSKGDVIKIDSGYTRDNRGRTELHMGSRSKIVMDAKAEINVRERRKRKNIEDLAENENDVEIVGTIVQIFDPNFFEVCPECSKRAREKDEGYFCEEHGKVKPTYSYVANMFLDDGTENIRVVLWRNQLQHLFGMSNEEIITNRDEGFEEKQNDLLGKIIKLVGRTQMNERYERLEFIPQVVITDPDPEEEIKRLNEELKEPDASLEKEVPVEAKAPEPAAKPVEKKEEPAETKEAAPEKKPEVEKIDLDKVDADDVKEPDEFLEDIDDLDDLDDLEI